MKQVNRYKIICLCLFLLSSPTYSQISPQSPYKVFDESIYDQREIKEFLDANYQFVRGDLRQYFERGDHAVSKTILKQLTLKKIGFLEEFIFKAFDMEMDDLRRLAEKYKKSVGAKVLDYSGKVVGSAAGIGAAAAIPGVGPEIAAMRLGMRVMGGMSVIGTGISGIHEFIKEDGQLDIDKVQAALLRKKKQLVLEVNQENGISDLEIRYVLVKNLMQNPEVERRIESALINARKPGVLGIDFFREFLINTLRLPFRKKKISLNPVLWGLEDPHHFEEALVRGDLTREQADAGKKLCAYSPETREALSHLVVQTQYSSRSPIPSYRRFHYFYGAPGVGKTTASRELAQLLDIPVFETNIRTGDDVSQEALEGADWMRPDAKVGSLSHALMKGFLPRREESIELKLDIRRAANYGVTDHLDISVPNPIWEETYLNSMLIINDFDRLLLDPTTTTQTLAFFLDYLDPSKKSFYSPYFKAYIPMDALVIVVTGNNFIPDEDRFKALKDRLIETEFTGFSEVQRQLIFGQFFDEIREKYNPMFLIPADREAILTPLHNPEGVSIRDGKKVIERELLRRRIAIRPPALIDAPLGDVPDPLLPQGDGEVGVVAVGVAVGPQVPDGFILPVMGLADALLDQMVVKKLDAYKEIRDCIVRLGSTIQTEQRKSVEDLLKGSLFSDGVISRLWTTKTRRRYPEGPGTIGAFANRVRDTRFDTPQQKGTVVRLHLKTLSDLLDGLLKFGYSADAERGYVYRLISEDRRTRENLNLFTRHLVALRDGFREDGSFSSDIYRDEVPLPDMAVRDLEDYRKLIGEKLVRLQLNYAGILNPIA
jgi:hypothetical protein